MNWQEDYAKAFRKHYEGILSSEMIDKSIQWNLEFMGTYMSRSEKEPKLEKLDEKFSNHLVDILLDVKDKKLECYDAHILIMNYHKIGTPAIPTVEDIKEVLRLMPSVGFACVKIGGRVFHSMCKDDIAQAIHSKLKGAI